MRVAFLTMGKDIGGAKQDVITLSQKIAASGHDVFVVSALGVMDRELEHTSVRFIPAEFYVRRPWELWKASRYLLRVVREYDIELVNPQGFFTAVIAWLMRFSLRRPHIPIVTTIHMFSSLSFYKYARLLNVFSDEIITESNCERIRLESGGAKRNRIEVINNSVDMQRFSRERTLPVLRTEYDIEQDCVVFGIVARLSPEKRHEDYIEAAKIVHRRFPNTRFFIVGDGPRRDELQAQAAGHDYIVFTGARRDIPDVLRSLDCFVLSSEVESLPLSIREAMSMSLPVVATDVGGNREIVAEGITGFLVRPKSPDQLAAAMSNVVEDRLSREVMGKAARRFCKDRFNADDWTVYTERKFEQCINHY